jgi:signal transduction histidine kinase
MRYVQRTREPLVVGDAARDDRFARDPYFKDLDCCSLLALPILSRGELRAVLVLENRLMRSAFTAERLDAVKLIAAQLAVSLDNAQLYADFRRIAGEQAALRRVATLVARGAGPDVMFGAVAEEAGALFGADGTAIVRFEPDGDATVMGDHGFERRLTGSRGKPQPHSAVGSVRATERAARHDAEDSASGTLGELTPEAFRSAVASPIVVAGRLWGAMGVGRRSGRLPQDTEQRLAEFTELIATAIANAESRAELTASRARIVAAADETRQRIERDLHDGAQQRLASLSLQLRAAQAAVPPELGDLAAELDGVAAGLLGALEELREYARGIHPAILVEGGLRPALRALARRCAIPVTLEVSTDGRLPEHVEVTVGTGDGDVRLSVSDDGVGGADFSRGSGLMGLKDRVEAIGGSLTVHSRPGQGTRLRAEVPLTAR